MTTRPALFPCRRCKSTTWAVTQTPWAPKVTCSTCGKFVGYDRHNATDGPSRVTHDERAPDIRREPAAASGAKLGALASMPAGKGRGQNAVFPKPATEMDGEFLLFDSVEGINR